MMVSWLQLVSRHVIEVQEILNSVAHGAHHISYVLLCFVLISVKYYTMFLT